jgi:hypothetical protein
VAGDDMNPEHRKGVWMIYDVEVSRTWIPEQKRIIDISSSKANGVTEEEISLGTADSSNLVYKDYKPWQDF